MRTEAPLLAPVFRSEGQARLLAVLLLGEAELSITDLAARAHLAYPTAHREVTRLLDAGILAERGVGRSRLIRANPDSPLTDPLRQILLVATGPVALLAEEFAAVPGVESAFLYGSFAARMQGIDGPAPQDIDVMVVGTPDAAAVYDACERVEQLVGRPVNPTIITHEELSRESGFLDHVRANPIVLVTGELPWR
ncbi:MAG: winged helix-turn-helix domain-containing protein [Propionicimonas sp.]|uniref:winged helix-turn-helix domain-containing protein n=1 Tax=Propionicimonas sp. TaxID=1955623 RepID=UPI002B1FCB94|nr:winged helix-turn-helix domain-containing protein [Propionicimonas sp.]MEA4944800.1 winged helix-turn-helix domain-containing protein [Propionicimonas sp.]MEA5117110.1 winged helix-turn-helix domain-containing protein [Propionicimonas sp.]